MELNGGVSLNGDVLNGEVGWPVAKTYTMSEALNIVEAGFKKQIYIRDDLVSVVDAGKNYAQVITVSGAVIFADERVSGKVYIRYLTDGTVFFDEFIKSVILGGTGGIIVTKVQDDFVTLTDGVVSWVYRRKDLSELLTILDNTTTARSYIKQLTESLIIGDSVLSYHFWNRRSEDVITLTDQIIKWLRDVRLLIENVGVGDDSFNWKRRTGLATESITVTDELKFWRRIVRFNDELLTLVDGFIKSIVSGGGVINTRIVSEFTEFTDSTGRYVTRVSLASEAITFSDSTIRALARIRYIAESVDIIDGFATFKIRRSTLSELLDIPDSIVSLYFPSVTYAVRIRIASAVSAVLGYDYDNRVGAEYSNVLCDDEPNLLGSRADNLLGATA